ncbi:RnfABCDGE type electron transport complex subunit G [Crenobacter sp. SG2305]|uniref:RnfABCDGE type electron transport complex subunit G n=1 Tax=Crenobacter oryzisoli TaxID=3056844 RepID=UPI0025AACAB3|nr:RnfABCDGE type electron transport complex subunit G [Crenobacter sp. SG2305]MDN0083979.1 RnfABCDGE type electron transport complex subunit G [Crenobacter sp. SG2305]
MNDALHQARRSALTLLVFSVACTGLLAGTHLLTEHTIRANEKAVKQTLISQTLPTGSYDNDPAASAVALSPDDAAMLGNAGLANVYIATRAGKPVAFVFETQADNGYGDRIRLLVGINATGTVSGVRVIAHKETPGLGSYIDSGRSEWLSQYDGRAADAGGKVSKDGSNFNRTTGTTLSARAVSGAVDRVVAYYREHATRFAALP